MLRQIAWRRGLEIVEAGSSVLEKWFFFILSKVPDKQKGCCRTTVKINTSIFNRNEFLMNF